MTYEKAVILDQLKETMQREQNANQYIFRNTDVSEKEINNIINSLDSLHEEKKKLLNYLQSIKTNDKKLELKLKNDIENIKGNWLEKAIRESENIFKYEEIHKYLGKAKIELPKTLHIEAIICAIKQDKSFKQFCTESIQRTVESLQERKSYIINPIDEILQTIKEKSDFRGKISTSIDDVSRNLAIINSNVLSEGISKFFTINNRIEAIMLGEYLADFLNEIYGIFYDDIKNYAESKHMSFKFYQMTFIGYMALAKELYGKDKWRNKLEEILNKIDFSKDNRTLADLVNIDLVDLDVALNKRNIENIDTYFTALCRITI